MTDKPVVADGEATTKDQYATATPEHLLAALEQAGETPERALLEACLARRDDLVPGLLAMLEAGDAQGYDEDWDEDDPRWYRDVHAGLLLIALRAEEALPLFADLFRDEERENLWEWFATSFRHYGPPAVDVLIDLFEDRDAAMWPRLGAAEKLKDVALMHPETRDRIVEVLRASLPRLRDDGRFASPPPKDDEHVEFWSFVAYALADLKDAASQPSVKALYRAGLINETVMGDEAAYLAFFDEDPQEREPFDLVEFYHPSPEHLAQREAAMQKLLDEADASFLALSTEELLDALENAGHVPEPGLIRTCFKRQEALVPGLLDLLARPEDPDWEEEDPRLYRAVHAGRLLIAFREEKALPVFEKVLREAQDTFLLDWFSEELPYYGPAALPTFTRLFEDETVPSQTRTTVTVLLKGVAQLYPEAEAQVVATLRAALPPLSDRGDPDVPADVGKEQIRRWTALAYTLARLGDTASQPQVEALHDWYLIDETLYGDYDGYLEVLHSDDDPDALPPEFDLAFWYLEHHLRIALRYAKAPFEASAGDGASPFEVGYGGGATYVREEKKVGRNEPCPCGSGKKYKKCCGKR